MLSPSRAGQGSMESSLVFRHVAKTKVICLNKHHANACWAHIFVFCDVAQRIQSRQVDAEPRHVRMMSPLGKLVPKRRCRVCGPGADRFLGFNPGSSRPVRRSTLFASTSFVWEGAMFQEDIGMLSAQELALRHQRHAGHA